MRSAALLVVPAAAAAAIAEPGDVAIDFNRDIRPILSANCYKCHGPDGNARQAGLRLDQPQQAFAERRPGRAAIVPGDPTASLLVERTASTDPDFRMPPPESNKTLTDDEIARLERWIESGAEWQPHWSFVTPHDEPPPAVRGSGWPRNGIDHFVLARLESEGLEPAPQATRETLIRRVSFDLTGLPPTLAEIDAFLADDAPGAYERVVDRLLASPRYGERMAMAWLDVARYADTHGYHYDNERTMWPWRDWVIDAYNRNLPFDEFTTEQLAGDLLAEPTPGQRIATGFNRNHGISWEGGIIPEEYQVEYVVDRVGTTSAAWLGLTMGCARCHEHKFDPISQKEFYELAAFFNTIPEKGADGLKGNAVPFIEAPNEDHARKLSILDEAIAELTAKYDAPRPDDAQRLTWEAETAERWRSAWTILDPFAFKSEGGATLVEQDDRSLLAEGKHPDAETYEIVALTTMTGIRAVRLEAMADERLPEGGPGRAFHANIVLSEFELEVAPISDSAPAASVEFATAIADHSQTNFYVRKAIDGQRPTGWALNGARYGEDRVAIFVPTASFGFEGGTALRFRIRMDSDYMKHAIGRVRLAITADETIAAALEPSSFGTWSMVGPFLAESSTAAHETDFGPERAVDHDAIYDKGLADDGVGAWTPRPDLTDDKIHSLSKAENAATYLSREITAPNDRRLVMSFGSDDAIKAWLNGELILEADAPRGAAMDQNIVTATLRAGSNDLLVKITNYGGEYAFYFDPRDDDALDPPLMTLGQLNRRPQERNDQQRTELRNHWLVTHSPEAGALLEKLTDKRSDRAAVAAEVPTVMVMTEMEEPRTTHVLMRGRYDRPREAVTAGVPACLPELPEDAPPNRLGLARWLTDPDHPLTPRVAVNRYWQMHFGQGLVETQEDFGSQGSSPTHPALLDWLAREFVRSGWDVKHMQRLIVTSATYQQSAAVTPELLAGDPRNELLARGPRFRLSAEMIRDSALAASGLLHEKIGGPPVKPYQPDGLWREVGSDFDNAFSANRYVRDTGEGLYRRSMYTFWKRTLPPPALATFDAPTREFCVVRRSRTNTPLQALVLLNDPTYVEAARFLAQRMLTDLPDDADAAARATHGFRITTSRRPTAHELELVVGLYEEQRSAFAADPDAVRELLGVGEATHRKALDGTELAAWAMVASALLNLDEAITKG